MHRQVGHLETDSRGIATRGLIIRHLVMPNNIGGTDRLVRWIAKEPIIPRSHAASPARSGSRRLPGPKRRASRTPTPEFGLDDHSTWPSVIEERSEND
jgi:hypothetical protein